MAFCDLSNRWLLFNFAGQLMVVLVDGPDDLAGSKWKDDASD